LVPAVVITAVIVKEQRAPSAREGKSDALPRGVPGVAVLFEPPLPSVAVPTQSLPEVKLPITSTRADEIADPVGRGRRLIAAGDIPNARLALQQAAEAGNATAALELGATYDPVELKKLGALAEPSGAVSYYAPTRVVGKIERKVLPDIAMARTWYQRAKDLGSPEAAGRLERLSQREEPAR
jgi:hypothetical protein